MIVPEHPGDLLSALADGAVTPAEGAEIRAHLDGCTPCRVEWTLVIEARTAVRSLGDVEPPDGFIEALIARIATLPETAAAFPLAPDAAVVSLARVVPIGAARRSPTRTLGIVVSSLVAVAAAIAFVAAPGGTAGERVRPQLQTFVQAHGSSTSGGEPLQLTPLAVPVGFGR